jgi:anti-sigma factor (TIGR02949 family)
MSHPIACQDAIRQLWNYLDGDVDPSDQERIEKHLTFCLRCCGELEFARELREVLRTKSATSVPDATALERLRSFVDDLPIDEPGSDDPPTDDI